MKAKYHRRTLDALIRHLMQPGGSTTTYLRAHPRVSQAQIDAIFEDLYTGLDRMAAQAKSGSEPSGEGP